MEELAGPKAHASDRLRLAFGYRASTFKLRSVEYSILKDDSLNYWDGRGDKHLVVYFGKVAYSVHFIRLPNAHYRVGNPGLKKPR